jgi:FkbM family methyltransferase
MLLLLKNLIGSLLVKLNYFLGSYSVPLANLVMMVFLKKIRFKRRLDISSNVYEVTEVSELSSSQKELHHFFHMPERLHNYAIGIQKKGQRLAESYGVDRLEFNPEDIILDVGANSGDSLIYFRNLGIPLSVYCFEPDPKALESLNKNAAAWSECVEVVPHPLGDTEGPITLYLSTLGGDSSLSRPLSYENEIVVESFTLDGWFERERLKGKLGKPIKLMKLEAEGFEPEILQGALSILDKVEYIAADLGWERGEKQECTIPQVMNLLLVNRFRLKWVSRDGVHFLFENIDLSKSKV